MREALKGGSPAYALAPRAGSSARPEGMGSCCALKGLQGRDQRGTGLPGEKRGGWRGERREVERQGAQGQAKSSILGGTTEDQAFLGDGSQGERRLFRGTRGEGAKVLQTEMGMCC